MNSSLNLLGLSFYFNFLIYLLKYRLNQINNQIKTFLKKKNEKTKLYIMKIKFEKIKKFNNPINIYEQKQYEYDIINNYEK